LIRWPNSVRAAMVSVAAGALLALTACQDEGQFSYNARANAPIPPALMAEIEKKNMDKESPILVRLFKEEAELEVWKQDRTGRFALLKTYPICRWSGDLGPKVKEGDRQAPEGFYTITPAQMNPNSSYYLSFNLGYPNAYDQAWGRTGSQLMVHGDCSSRGCYAMSDEQISEIFALGRESFFGGQKGFQVQAYPFRMTPDNMARHRNNPNYAFWKMLKRGNDHFEVTRLEPKVDVCEKRYVFDAEPREGATAPLKFSPAGKCPAFQIPEEIAAAVQDKQRRDEYKIAELTARNVPTAPIMSNRDGGMHPSFLAKLNPQEVVDDKGKIRLVIDKNATAPAAVTTIAYNTAGPDTGEPAPTVVADAPVPRAAPRPKEGSRPQSSFADKLAALFNPKPAEAKAAETPAPAEAEPAKKRSVFALPRSKPEPMSQTKTADAAKEGVAAKISRKLGLRSGEPSAESEKGKAPADAASPQPEVKTAAAANETKSPLLSGAQPIVPTASFDSRWSAFR
jgi:murein L,D-transpeptidase YafK